ncbi:hypothetical protein PQX77_011110 [Marasmius sp. AFHP31]|nr:hypothetical protein PQX77_011110 [Marasmius sp. AFHP31]
MTDEMCDYFTSPQGKKDMTKFRSFINNLPDNLILLNSKVNDAKGKCFNPNVQLGNEQAALGVVDYVTRIKSDAETVANKIKAKMDDIAQTAGFPSFKSTFAKDYIKTLDSVISTAQDNADRLGGLAPPTTSSASTPPTTSSTSTPPTTSPAAPPTTPPTTGKRKGAPGSATAGQGPATKKPKTSTKPPASPPKSGSKSPAKPSPPRKPVKKPKKGGK